VGTERVGAAISIARLTFASDGERHAFHDVGQAIANLTFQANASGLAVCQMAGFDIQKARETYSIPEDHEPITVSAIGYPGIPQRFLKGCDRSK